MTDLPNPSSRRLASALIRVVVAGRDEVLALEEAVLVVPLAEVPRLQRQVRRRLEFRKDLDAAILACGGTPTLDGAFGERLLRTLRGVRGWLFARGARNAYASCTRAAANSIARYAQVGTLELPSDMRFGIDRQHSQVEVDFDELTRLRWSDRRPAAEPGATSLAVTLDDDEGAAFEVWTDDGGRRDDARR
jgi:hypothetical protein